MKKYITDEKNGLDYTLVNGVYLPNLISTETNYRIGTWGQISSADSVKISLMKLPNVL